MQSMTFLLPSMKIDQSTVEGNIKILMTIIKKILQLPESWFHDNTRIIVAGDQLTVARVAAAKVLHSRDTTPLERLQWATPVIQLFHLQMIVCSTILRTHYESRATPGSLAFLLLFCIASGWPWTLPTTMLQMKFWGMYSMLWFCDCGKLS